MSQDSWIDPAEMAELVRKVRNPPAGQKGPEPNLQSGVGATEGGEFLIGAAAGLPPSSASPPGLGEPPREKIASVRRKLAEIKERAEKHGLLRTRGNFLSSVASAPPPLVNKSPDGTERSSLSQRAEAFLSGLRLHLGVGKVDVHLVDSAGYSLVHLDEEDAGSLAASTLREARIRALEAVDQSMVPVMRIQEPEGRTPLWVLPSQSRYGTHFLMMRTDRPLDQYDLMPLRSQLSSVFS